MDLQTSNWRRLGGRLALALACAFTVIPLSVATASNTIVRMDTNFGLIDIELFDSAAPNTVQNFLGYATSGLYQDVIIHRLAPGFVVQGGAFTSTFGINPTVSPVVNEFNHKNLRGTIAMAKLPGNPDSATNQFFFNLSDNNAADLDTQNGGFTVFGRVIGNGMSVIDSITNLPYGNFGYEEFGIDPRVDVSALPVRNYGQAEYDAAIRPDATNLLIINDVYVVDGVTPVYQNQQNHFDVTNSGSVLPQDLIALIDELSRTGERALSDNFVGPLYVDVDGNQRFNQTDVNLLVRQLNSQFATGLNSSVATGLLAMSEFSGDQLTAEPLSFAQSMSAITVVPEPTSALLGVLAVAGFAWACRRRRA